MSNNILDTFTDRREAVALFEEIRGRDQTKEWPVLPILAFIAPGGSGKSTLLKYLRTKRCSYGSKPAIPYVHLDFNLATAPTEFLLILINMRDQLQQLVDDQGRHLKFPRFDLGALIALTTSGHQDPPSLSSAQVQRKLTAGMHFFESLTTVGSSLGSVIGHSIPYISYVSLILETLKSAGQIKPVQDILNVLLNNIGNSGGWQWYRQHGSQTGIGINANVREVLLRLQALSMPGRPEQEMLIRELLPAAFIADLFDALLSDPPHAWSNTANVIFFLDGFETLQKANESTANLLLRALTIDYLKENSPGPILLVLGSRDRLPGFNNAEQISLEPAVQNEKELKDHVREIYGEWRKNLLSEKKYLHLSNLYLVFPLHDFGHNDTRQFLLNFGEQKQEKIFAEKASLLQTIEQVTRGHPLFLALAAAAVLEAKAQKRELKRSDFVEALVPSDVVPEYSEEQIGEFLLKLFLRQLEEDQRDKLIRCAAPRFLDEGILRAILQLASDNEARKLFKNYQRYTFLQISNEKQVIFHPVVRDLLLQLLPPSRRPNSDYRSTHNCLRAYFHDCAVAGDDQAVIEEAYHTLALGDPKFSIRLGPLAHQDKLTLWEPLMKAIAEAPTELQPNDIKEQADKAFEQAQLPDRVEADRVEDWVTAIVLYQWLLRASQVDSNERASLWYNMGILYTYMQGGNQQANLQRAINCYDEALKIYTYEQFPEKWAITHIYEGEAYCLLRGRNRLGTRQQGIDCYRKALTVCTEERLPFEWARIQNNLGEAYSDMPSEALQANLNEAITCYEQALKVRTIQTSPFDWAITKNNLGNAYLHLPTGKRLENVAQAIACYEEALSVHTREDHRLEWARAKNNLGNAFRHRPWNDPQEKLINLTKAINYYEEALDVRTKEQYPVDWAATQHNLGLAYSIDIDQQDQLDQLDQQERLKQAIFHFELALQVFTLETYPIEWAKAQNAFGNVYRSLPGKDQKENAIACYKAALEILTQDASPVEWARVQHNMGIAYSLFGKNQQTIVQEAMNCFEKALKVRTYKTLPEEWAKTQNALGNLYYYMRTGDRKENLKKAVFRYQDALRIFTAFGITHLIKKVRQELNNALDAQKGSKRKW